LVAFSSDASDLVPGPDSFDSYDVFVRDRTAGTTRRVSLSGITGSHADGDCSAPSISGDGRVVAFASDATNLVARDPNRSPDVFVRNRALATTVRISLTSSGTQARHTLDGSGAPVISENGRLVAFQSAASNLVARDTNRTTDVFVRD